MLKIYNTLNQTKEIFKPSKDNTVGIYICGPTVYDYIHIGNARSFTAFDMIVRFLKFSGYKVNYVRNITDIDDKIIKRAKETDQEFSAVAQKFTRAFCEDLKNLGLLSPNKEPLATQNIPQIIDLIKKLIKNNYAYVADCGDVYFQVRNFKNYGCLSKQNLDEIESGARVEVSSFKHNPLDFVLWKMAKEGEPAWSSPWGDGRPGWHIECSAMSKELLGESFDIHGGGRDLIFPHHENEIAQSEAVSGKPFVKYWLHTGYLQMDKEKMSKSLGNFLTLRDLLEDNLPEVLRFFLLSSHYRSPLQFSEEALSRAHQSLSRLYGAIDGLPQVEINDFKANEFSKKFILAMEDDFNTPVAFAVLFDLAHEIQRLREIDIKKSAELSAVLRYLGGVFGLLRMNPAEIIQGTISTDEKNYIEEMLVRRESARANKNWAEADRIRNELLEKSIILEDCDTGTRWRKS